jgi:hypothetical protein
LRDAAVSLIAYGGAIAGAAWIAGPARAAIAVRRSIAPTLREHPAVIYGLLAFALLIFLAIGPVDGNRLVPLLALFGFACLGAEAFRRQTAREFPATPRWLDGGYHSSLRALEPRKRGLGRRSPVNLLAYARLSSPATASADPSVVIQSGKSIGCL